MFYTNGCDIAGADDEILENGETINPGYVHQWQCDQNNYYTAGYQSSITLPLPGSNSVYYLFHKRTIIVNNPFDVLTDKLLFSVVDMSLNNGKGRVISKNVELMSDSLAFGEMTAVKHANGTDWWLITPRDHSNTFYVFLFTKDGIVDTLEQSLGIKQPVNASGGMQVVFSPDGSKYFRSVPSGPILMYDFDRTTGQFTQFDSIHIDYKNWPSIANGCAVSPNSRFFYVCAELNIFQFDLWAGDISSSQVTVAEWDGFVAPVATIFGQSQLGPDCKIYVSTIDSKYYHVINSPDEPGLACNVTQHSFLFPTSTGASIPFFPNYRLGPIDNPGLPCSPVVSTSSQTAPLPGFTVFPNPVSTMLSIVPKWQFDGQGRFRLFDVAGCLVRDLEFDASVPATEISVSGITGGVYIFEVWADGRKQHTGKVIKIE